MSLTTALCETLASGKMPPTVPVTRDMYIRDKKFDRLMVTFFDLAGGERQRIFWRQHYMGCQGIIFLIDSSAPQYLDVALQELEKSIASSGGLCPIAVCLSKRDLVKEQEMTTLRNRLMDWLKRFPVETRIFSITCRDVAVVNEMIKWLLSRSKAL